MRAGGDRLRRLDPPEAKHMGRSRDRPSRKTRPATTPTATAPPSTARNGALAKGRVKLTPSAIFHYSGRLTRCLLALALVSWMRVVDAVCWAVAWLWHHPLAVARSLWNFLFRIATLERRLSRLRFGSTRPLQQQSRRQPRTQMTYFARHLQ